MASEPPPSPRQARPGRRPESGVPKWAMWAGLAAVLGLFLLAPTFSTGKGEDITYTQFLERVRASKVESVTVDNNGNGISGEDRDGSSFKVSGPDEIPEGDLELLREKGVDVDFDTPQPNFFLGLIPYLLPFFLIMGLFIWMNRRASGQMGSVMQIG